MTLVLDTSIIIDVERKHQPTIARLQSLVGVYPVPARITFVTEFEFILGTKEKNITNREKALSFLQHFAVIHTTRETSSLLAELKYKYDRKGISLSLADLLIACLVIENNLILVTKDPDFKNLEELRKIII